MVQLKRIAKVSFVALMVSIMKASCYVGTSGKATSSVLQSDAAVEQNLGSNAFEHLAEHISSHFVNHMVSALQTESASFIQTESQFDFKSVAKEQAQNLLKEVLRSSLLPVEESVAESVSPPTLSPPISKMVKLGLKDLFNKAEKYAGVKVPDSIWFKEDEEENEDDENEREDSEEEEAEEDNEEDENEESDD